MQSVALRGGSPAMVRRTFCFVVVRVVVLSVSVIAGLITVAKEAVENFSSG